MASQVCAVSVSRGGVVEEGDSPRLYDLLRFVGLRRNLRPEGNSLIRM